MYFGYIIDQLIIIDQCSLLVTYQFGRNMHIYLWCASHALLFESYIYTTDFSIAFFRGSYGETVEILEAVLFRSVSTERELSAVNKKGHRNIAFSPHRLFRFSKMNSTTVCFFFNFRYYLTKKPWTRKRKLRKRKRIENTSIYVYKYVLYRIPFLNLIDIANWFKER